MPKLNTYELKSSVDANLQVLGIIPGNGAEFETVRVSQVALSNFTRAVTEETLTSGTTNNSNNLGGQAPSYYATAVQGELAESAVQPSELSAALGAKVDKEAGKGLSSNDFTSAEKSKLAGLESSHFKGLHVSLAALEIAHPTGSAGDYADVDPGAGSAVRRYIWDVSDSQWQQQAGSGGSMTAAQVKSAYESNPDTNAYTDAEQTKLAGVATGATANANTDSLAEGATNKYFTESRVRSAVLTGLSLLTGGTIAAADTLLVALGKLQNQISGKQDALVSGTTLKTVNGQSLLGAGNLAVEDNGGFRNKIINGKMEIAQRGVSFPAINGYTLDRWAVALGGAGVVTVTQQADAPPSNEFRNSLRVVVTTADTSIAATDFALVLQRIEGLNVRDLIGKSFTFSFWVRSPKAGVHCVAFRNAGMDRSYVLEYTVNVANTWEFKTVTVAGGLITAGTWDWTNGLGVDAVFVLAAGSNFKTTAGQWQSGNFIATSGQVNCLDTVGNIFAITGVQLEVGPVATPFEHRPIGVEADLCLRYFCKTFPMSVAPANGTGREGTLVAATYPLNMFGFANWRFPLPMRAAPSVATFSYVGVSGYWIDGGAVSGSTAGVLDVSTSSVSIFLNSGAQFTGGTNIFYIHATADAEL